MIVNAIGGVSSSVSRLKNINSNSKLSSNPTDNFQKNNVYNSVSFTAKGFKGAVKLRGMLFHITGLPAERSLCGQFLDPNTDRFIQWLTDAKQTHWIMNPLYSIGPDCCPYLPFSSSAMNKYVVNMNKCVEEGYGKLLKKSELPWDIPSERFTYDGLQRQKDPLFHKAFKRFQKLDETHPLKQEYRKFEQNGDKGLDGSAAAAIAPHYGKDWRMWPKQLLMLPETVSETKVSFAEATLAALRGSGKNKKDIAKSMEQFDQFKFEQFLFDKQFNEFIGLLKKRGITLVQDKPIGDSIEGVEPWLNKKAYMLDEKFNPVKLSGAPPEEAYPYTQVWGHPMYNYDAPEFWNYQEETLRKMIGKSDLRLDHFVGYINRAEIPVNYAAKNGKVLERDEIFKVLGKDFYDPKWTVRVDEKLNPRGENIFEMFNRVAIEEGKNPKDCYILEDFGPLAETEAYKKFKTSIGEGYMSQRLPISMGIGTSVKAPQLSNSSSIDKFKEQMNIAVLTGNHDLPSLRETVDLLMTSKPKVFKDGSMNSPALFRTFCKEELELTNKEMKDGDFVARQIMKWHYAQSNVKQVQTTLQDALGLYFRPNVPGFWNGMEDKYLMKSTKEALQGYWNNVFPKDFLDRINKSGINPGYKDRADTFIEIMQNLFNK